MKPTSHAVLALAGIACLATPAFGERLDPSAIPANTRFLVHIDMGGVQKTQLFQAMLGLAEEEGEDPFAELRQVEAEFGLDPLRDIHSATFYSQSSDPESAVVMLAGNAKIDDAIARLSQEEGYVTVEVEGFRLHVLEVEGETQYGYVQERGDRRVVLISPNKKELLRGALVLCGRQPSMADVDEPALNLRPRKGSFLFVSVAGDLPGMEDFEPASAVFDMAKSFTFDLGEREGVLNAHLEVTTDSEKTAHQVRDILQGVVAFARLAAGMEDVPDEIPFDLLDGLKFSTEKNSVHVRFSFATKDLLGLAEELGAFD